MKTAKQLIQENNDRINQTAVTLNNTNEALSINAKSLKSTDELIDSLKKQMGYVRSN